MWRPLLVISCLINWWDSALHEYLRFPLFMPNKNSILKTPRGEKMPWMLCWVFTGQPTLTLPPSAEAILIRASFVTLTSLWISSIVQGAWHYKFQCYSEVRATTTGTTWNIWLLVLVIKNLYQELLFWKHRESKIKGGEGWWEKETRLF